MDPFIDPAAPQPLADSPSARLREENLRLRQSLARWKGRALRDPLTGLPNRRGWLRAVRKAAQKISRGETQAGILGVALFDLIDFKRFNDDHGLAAGDLRLQAAAQGFRRRTPEERRPLIWARLGGDEFGAFDVFPASWSAREFAEFWQARQAVLEAPAAIQASGVDPAASGGAIRFHMGWAFGKCDLNPTSSHQPAPWKSAWARLYAEASLALAAAKRTAMEK